MPNKPLKELVTPDWLQAQIKAAGIRVTDIVAATSVNQTNVSAWINGLRTMSAPVKAMFYFYFKSL